MTTTTAKNETRICRLCGEEKEIDLFERDKRVTGGITTRCRECKYALDDRASVLYRSLKHRAERDGQPLEVTRKELQALLAAFDGKCIYCGISEEEAGRTHHIDHLIPVSDGGRHHRSNLVLACALCNLSKGNAPFFEFFIRKRDEIGDENFNTLMYYIAFMSGQPIDEVITSFILDYKKQAYPHLGDFIDEKEMQELIHEAVQEKLKTEVA